MIKEQTHLGSDTVTVVAPARLHMGFFDMNGNLGRKFGSAGLCLSDIATRITVTKNEQIVATGPVAEQAKAHAKTMLAHLNLSKGVKIEIKEAIPRHVGLGSGTQLSLAIGAAITRLFEKSISTQEIATLFHRGIRSGIGIGAFSAGGFIIDGGRNESTAVPPVIAHAPFPEAWRILLIFDDKLQGLSSTDERQAFMNLPKMQADVAAALCRCTLMQLLPALHERDCEQFGQAISFIQGIIGEHFRPMQQGRYRSPFMEQVLEELQSLKASGTGQSSWGPTSFAFYPNETLASEALREIRKRWTHEPRLTFTLCRGRNTAAEITRHHSDTEINYKIKTHTHLEQEKHAQ